MSSAILYLAIVVIWAIVLVPRFLRHPHTTAQPADMHDPGLDGADQVPGAVTSPADGKNPAARVRLLAETGAAAETEAGAEAGTGRGPGAAPAGRSPAERRARILRTRRRLLSTLVLLAAGTAGLAAAHRAAWWVAVPPTVMAAGFLLLLRGAARIDAARAADRTYAEWSYPAEPGERYDDTVPAAEAGGPHEDPAPAAAASRRKDRAPAVATAQAMATAHMAEPDAEIIDISARVGDQFYDQCTDAGARAIGD